MTTQSKTPHSGIETKEIWAACGERAPWLIMEGQCPLPVPDIAEGLRAVGDK